MQYSKITLLRTLFNTAHTISDFNCLNLSTSIEACFFFIERLPFMTIGLTFKTKCKWRWKTKCHHWRKYHTLFDCLYDCKDRWIYKLKIAFIYLQIHNRFLASLGFWENSWKLFNGTFRTFTAVIAYFHLTKIIFIFNWCTVAWDSWKVELYVVKHSK